MANFFEKGNNNKEEGIAMGKERDQVVNGNMVNSMEELKQLGKQMENMRDGQQLEEAGRENDPQQFDGVDN